MALINLWKNTWEKGNRIGKGGQGLTHFAIHKESQEFYVIKFLKEQGSKERRERMFSEVTTLKILDHPNIPKLIDSNEHLFNDSNYELYMVTEYIPGETLQKYIESRGTMTLQEAISFTIKLSEVVKYCHLKGSVHRDIKPDNIILKDNDIDYPFLIDFGLSFNEDIPFEEDVTPSWQHLGNRFLSLPELRVSEGNKRDFRSDVTMVCGIFLFCLTVIHPTDLVDENLAKPHRREKSKKVIEKLPTYQIPSINYFFDIGFNQGINNRWQTIESIIINLNDILVMKNKDKSEQDIQERLEEHKALLEARLDYKHLDKIQNIFSKCDETIRRAAKVVINRLLPIRFVTIQTGHSSNVTKQVFTTQIGLKSQYSDEILFYPKFSCYSNGSEFVFDSVESKNRVELARFQINEEINWDKLADKIVEYYIIGITSKE